MPIYEYQVKEGLEGCSHCRRPFSVLQSMKEEPLQACEKCGSPIRRIVSRPVMKVASTLTPEQAAAHGFTTFKKAGKGTWEKAAGPGVDAIVGDPSTVSSPSPSKVYDLDGD